MLGNVGFAVAATYLWIQNRTRTPYSGPFVLSLVLLALFFIGYGALRFLIEYTREPDAHIGLIGPFSMGQILCSLMIAAGLLLWYQLVRAGQQK